jgi:Na+/pantothenate symporter
MSGYLDLWISERIFCKTEFGTNHFFRVFADFVDHYFFVLVTAVISFKLQDLLVGFCTLTLGSLLIRSFWYLVFGLYFSFIVRKKTDQSSYLIALRLSLVDNISSMQCIHLFIC